MFLIYSYIKTTIIDISLNLAFYWNDFISVWFIYIPRKAIDFHIYFIWNNFKSKFKKIAFYLPEIT